MRSLTPAKSEPQPQMNLHLPGRGSLFVFKLELYNIDSTKLLAVLRILLSIESNLLALFESLEAFAYDCREVYEYIIAAVVVGNKSVALFRVEPLNCTVVHFASSLIIFSALLPL